MTATTTCRRGRPRSQLVAIIRYTLQSCLPPRRWAAVLLPCFGARGLRAARRAACPVTADERFANVAAEAIFALTMPIAALVVGDAVLGAEVRAGTFHFTWLSPTRLWRIVVGRWIGGAIVVTRHDRAGVRARCARRRCAVRAPAPAFIAGGGRERSPTSRVFIAVGCITRRTAVWSLAIVFLVERLLGAALTGIAQISPTWLSRSTFVGLLDDPPSASRARGHPRRLGCGGPPGRRHRDLVGHRRVAHGADAPVGGDRLNPRIVRRPRRRGLRPLNSSWSPARGALAAEPGLRAARHRHRAGRSHSRRLLRGVRGRARAPRRP